MGFALLLAAFEEFISAFCVWQLYAALGYIQINVQWVLVLDFPLQ